MKTKLILFLLLMVVALGGCVENEKEIPCKTSKDCPSDLYCIEGGVGARTYLYCGKCRVSQDCGKTTLCVSGRCDPEMGSALLLLSIFLGLVLSMVAFHWDSLYELLLSDNFYREVRTYLVKRSEKHITYSSEDLKKRADYQEYMQERLSQRLWRCAFVFLMFSVLFSVIGPVYLKTNVFVTTVFQYLGLSLFLLGTVYYVVHAKFGALGGSYLACVMAWILHYGLSHSPIIVKDPYVLKTMVLLLLFGSGIFFIFEIDLRNKTKPSSEKKKIGYLFFSMVGGTFALVKFLNLVLEYLNGS